MLTVPQLAVKLVLFMLEGELATGAEGVGDGVGVGVNVAVAVGVAVGDGVGVGVNVAVAVGVAVGVPVGDGVGVGRGLGAAERLPSTIRPHAPAAKHAIAMSRFIPRKEGWRPCLRDTCYCSSTETAKRSFGNRRVFLTPG